MLDIKPAREIKGTYSLPPDVELLELACYASLAAAREIHVETLPESPVAARLRNRLEPCMDIRANAGGWRIEPKQDVSSVVEIPGADSRFRDLNVFLMLGAGRHVCVNPLPEALLERWRTKAKMLNCVICKGHLENGTACIRLSPESSLSTGKENLPPELLHPYMGLAMGMKSRVSFDIDYIFAGPLRHLAHALEYELSVKNATEHGGNSHLSKRLRFMGARPKQEQGLSFKVTADFSIKSGTVPAITLPGDETLGSLLILAKSLVQKGNLIIENFPLEIWSASMLNLVRKMGCRPAVQENRESAFGKTGMVQLQRFELSGKKTECVPDYYFKSQLPAMVALSCFAKGQSVFRKLSELRDNEPDGIEQILECIRAMGGRHGEMPDGIVIDGSNQTDGFDLLYRMPAPLSGACAIAGLKCIGATKINEESIVDRWPKFPEMLDTLCEYRK